MSSQTTAAIALMPDETEDRLEEKTAATKTPVNLKQKSYELQSYGQITCSKEKKANTLQSRAVVKTIRPKDQKTT